ncbi:unnamed protein product [Linum tenue]|uniref:Uncharacterized protein n=1 Tax=Linum tenue TaxID=586396 RepID=A0AAV0NTV8_9ROSI|nr:unnamed protein product [Linum tenue]
MAMMRGKRGVMATMLLLLALMTLEVCRGWDFSASQFWDKTKETMQQAAGQGKGAAEDTKEKISTDKKMELVSDKGHDAMQKIGEVAGDKGQDYSDLFANSIQTSQQRVEMATGGTVQNAKDMLGNAKENAQYAQQKVSEVAGDKAQNVKEILGNAKEKAQDTKEKVSQAAGDKAQDAKDKVSQAAADVGAHARNEKATADEL